MFPLEQTVLPTTLLPLHIFEPRYRELARVVTARAEPDFGVVMIERGREVGGGDERSGVGVVARVMQSEEFPDGRWAIMAMATRRIRIVEWLADLPFPRATVTDWPDDDAADQRGAIPAATMTAIGEGLSRVLAAAHRLDPGRPIGPIDLADDPAHATWQASVGAGLGPLDAMRLLSEPTASRRAGIAAGMILERAELLEALADQGG
jgi:ATP-dependent Lon protease